VFTLGRQCVFHAFYQAFELSNDVIASVGEFNGDNSWN
jgi:hypothetical protein